MAINQWQAELAERVLASSAARTVPISVSSDTGQLRSVEDRVQRIRTAERSGSRGSCQSGYSTWGD
ncbi:hypothetical protein O7632_16340 [Solwaraspora sp. WMMD406]|uniref:hypothetical protein n=1 Tax=Solwaraspora sp. WMMD406 TaxID=3016095 RepID=UPI0024174551|nr:hypothetical protein [Solwaraspora sp. WMMD406]MDG4765656.1 hypothetical protein [Solwaraspora sp. WMMD406]